MTENVFDREEALTSAGGKRASSCLDAGNKKKSKEQNATDR
jgi:hypothetical protein